jgi:hypothetical protein
VDSSISDPATVAAIDLERRGLEDIVQVDGWLTGSLLEPPCAAPDPGSYISSLPGRWCGGPDWVVDQAVEVGLGAPTPDGGAAVQNGAYEEFAPNPTQGGNAGEPRQGKYLLAKRLEGWCDGAKPPCWQWEVVGRLTDPNSASPTPTASTDGINCGDSSISVVDRTGLVSGCSTWEWNPGEMLDGSLSVTNQDGDLGTLLVRWVPLNGCISRATAEFTRDGGRYALVITEGPNVTNCLCPYTVKGFQVALASPVSANLVGVTVQEEASSPTTPPPTANSFDCLGPPLPPGETPPPGPVPVVIDETGLVESCLQTDAMAELTGRISVSNPFELNAVEVVWANGPCDVATQFTFQRAETGFSLTAERPSECSPGLGEPLPVYIRFTEPMPAESITPTLDG